MVESDVESGASSGFRMSAWIVLAATVGVVISGDIVQATESGAGCGESWPRCDGSLFPAFDDAATSIEFIHRAATSILSLLVVGLYIAARRSMEAGHRIRSAMNYVIVFLVVEVLVGALLVLFGWVEDDASFGRVVADGVHVINTFLLIGALVLVIHYAGGAIRPVWRPRTKRDRTILIGVALLLVIGVTGAINSLADTLFPADSLLDGVREEFGAAAPFLVRIRAIHPIVAIAGGSVVFLIARSLGSDHRESGYRLGRMIQMLVGVQFLIGILNIAWLTPLEIQVLHLLTADVLWVVFLMFSWRLLEVDQRVTSRGAIARLRA